MKTFILIISILIFSVLLIGCPVSNLSDKLGDWDLNYYRDHFRTNVDCKIIILDWDNNPATDDDAIFDCDEELGLDIGHGAWMDGRVYTVKYKAIGYTTIETQITGTNAKTIREFEIHLVKE